MHRTAYIIDTTWYRFSELDTKPLDQVIDPHRIGMDIMFARLPVDFTPDPTNPAYDLFMDTPEIIWRIIKKETK